MAKVEKGLILYNIEKDGCLNGVYTNEYCKGEIWNEILKKKTKDDDICGEYLCAYSEGKKIINDTLEIKKHENNNGSYNFEWGKYFTGYGYKINDHQIIVHYYEINK